MSRFLIVIAGPDQGRSFCLEDGQSLVIGRGQASDTQLSDPRMSRVHAAIEVDGGKTLLTDRGGSGGTRVDGASVTEHELQPGQTIQVGETQIRYQLDAPAEPRTMAPGRELEQKPHDSATLKELVGQSLAHYELMEIITAGHSGMVFKAQDTKENRVTAVKVLTPNPTSNDEQKNRFVRAMKTMLPIEHPNIVRLYNAGKTGPYCWAAMEYVEGESMVDVIRRIGVKGMLDWREAYRVALHVTRALQEAFEQKIIHRNVTPANILRRSSDNVCLLADLMLAKALEGNLAVQITQPGQLVGDVAYMSPERTRQQADVDCRSDIYGLGATLYALLTGHPPLESDSLPELVKMVREVEPQDPKESQLAINDKFRDLVMISLAKDPDDRYQTPAKLLRELEQIGKYSNVAID